MGNEDSTSASGTATGHETEMAKGIMCLLPDPPPEAKARVEPPTMGGARLCLIPDEPRPEAPRTSAWEVTDLDDADLGMRRAVHVDAVVVGHEVECVKGALCLLPTPPTESKVAVGGPTMGKGWLCLLPEQLSGPAMATGKMCLLPEDVSSPEMLGGRLCLLPEPSPEAHAREPEVGNFVDVEMARGQLCLLPTPPTNEELASRPTSIAVGYEVKLARGVMCLLPEAPPEAHATAAISDPEGLPRLCLVPV